MQNWIVPLAKPVPDCDRFIRALMGEITPARPPLIEYLVDEALRRPITLDMMGREWARPDSDRASQAAYWDNFADFWRRMGYDYVRLELGLAFASHSIAGADRTMVSHTRHWADEHRNVIASFSDLEAYLWPEVAKVDLFPLEYLATHLPEGMGLITNHAGGPFEVVTQIMSYEGFCLALYDAPDLVREVCEHVGSLMLCYYRQLVELPNLIALLQGDDMGFRSAPLAPPDVLRELILPWHQRFAQLAHDRGVPYFLHSCGQLAPLMEDLIEVVGIDGKHSFEDAILPAPEFQVRYGDRIATLGGVDVNLLAGGSPEQVQARTRELLTLCAPKGRYAIGSGNSIPSYVPVESYLAMLDTALTW